MQEALQLSSCMGPRCLPFPASALELSVRPRASAGGRSALSHPPAVGSGRARGGGGCGGSRAVAAAVVAARHSPTDTFDGHAAPPIDRWPPIARAPAPLLAGTTKAESVTHDAETAACGHSAWGRDVRVSTRGCGGVSSLPFSGRGQQPLVGPATAPARTAVGGPNHSRRLPAQ